MTLEPIRSTRASIVENQVPRIAGLGHELIIDDASGGPPRIDRLRAAFGVWHLQPNLDRQLVAALALAGQGSAYRSELADGEVGWLVTSD